MTTRMRYLVAAACGTMAALLTLLYLGGRSAAGPAETAIIWVAREHVAPGTQLSEAVLQQVRVDAPTRTLLAREALPTSPADTPGGWYALTPLAPGDPLIPGRNVSNRPAPTLPEGAAPDAMRVVTLAVDDLPGARAIVGEEVDLYVIPFGHEAVRILQRARVLEVEDGLISVLVPEAQVADVLTAAEGGAVKVVRHMAGIAP